MEDWAEIRHLYLAEEMPIKAIAVPSREEALEWAAKFAVACRCAQEIREIMFDPLV